MDEMAAVEFEMRFERGREGWARPGRMWDGDLTNERIRTTVWNERMTDPRDTKTILLNVAEELFANHGIDRVSVRDITHAAEVHIGSVNYHFGSKEGLIAAVFERRIGPVNQARLEALEELERGARPDAPPVEDVLSAFIRPAVDCCAACPSGGAAFAKLFGRCLAEPRPEVEELLKRQFEPLGEKLYAVLARALPHLARADIFWRMKFTFGALHHWLLTRDKCTPSWAEAFSLEAQTDKLIKFAAAGFHAA